LAVDTLVNYSKIFQWALGTNIQVSSTTAVCLAGKTRQHTRSSSFKLNRMS